MAKTIQGRGSTIYHQQESTNKYELTLKVFVKVFSQENLNNREIDKVKRCLDFLIDEPCEFFSFEKDPHSKNSLERIKKNSVLISDVELSTFNRKSTICIFIIKKIDINTKKIIEIICKDMFNYSIIFI